MKFIMFNRCNKLLNTTQFFNFSSPHKCSNIHIRKLVNTGQNNTLQNNIIHDWTRLYWKEIER
jgi:hypothetical protein